jgi:hypothetical protein
VEAAQTLCSTMTDATQLEAVKAYIAKWNLEDELSNAVNAAIKVDSDDPYRVISDYLKKFAKVRLPHRAIACAPPLSLRLLRCRRLPRR